MPQLSEDTVMNHNYSPALARPPSAPLFMFLSFILPLAGFIPGRLLTCVVYPSVHTNEPD